MQTNIVLANESLKQYHHVALDTYWEVAGVVEGGHVPLAHTMAHNGFQRSKSSLGMTGGSPDADVSGWEAGLLATGWCTAGMDSTALLAIPEYRNRHHAYQSRFRRVWVQHFASFTFCHMLSPNNC